MKYVEEREFVLRLELRCPFPDDYEGDEDGYAWAEAIAPLTAEVVQAATRVLKAQPGWRVRVGNRGRPTDEEVTLVVERVLAPVEGPASPAPATK
ncbi:MAG TPA: hypothetical protein VGF45_13300 [Polyangia bacterium]